MRWIRGCGSSSLLHSHYQSAPGSIRRLNGSRRFRSVRKCDVRYYAGGSDVNTQLQFDTIGVWSHGADQCCELTRGSDAMVTSRLEASVVHSICTQLENLGWVVNEADPSNNVTQQRVRTQTQRAQVADANMGRMRFPDFVLYERDSNRPICIIEAKRPGVSLDSALDQAEERYARPLNAPLIFAYNDTFVATRYLHNGRSLKIDGEDVRQFIDHYTALRFIHEGPEILSAPEICAAIA